MNWENEVYLITDESTDIDVLLSTVEAAIKGGVTIVQLREKHSGGRDFYEKAKRLKTLLDQYEIPLIINDRVDIALAVGASGVHVGQEDLPLTMVKKIVPDSMIVGISAATVELAQEAERNGADYIGVGSIFPTGTKKDATVLEEGMLSAIIDAVTIPVIAIGGIQKDNVATLNNQGIAGIAVISEIMSADHPMKAARALKEAFLS